MIILPCWKYYDSLFDLEKTSLNAIKKEQQSKSDTEVRRDHRPRRKESKSKPVDSSHSKTVENVKTSKKTERNKSDIGSMTPAMAVVENLNNSVKQEGCPNIGQADDHSGNISDLRKESDKSLSALKRSEKYRKSSFAAKIRES